MGGGWVMIVVVVVIGTWQAWDMMCDEIVTHEVGAEHAEGSSGGH
jgi:hypothetical protein